MPSRPRSQNPAGRKWRRMPAVIAAAAVVLVGACGGGGSEPAPLRDGGASAGSVAPDAGAEGKLLAFRGPAIGGGDVDAAAFAGRPVLLWFWSPW